ncbi:MAG: hypothetical protein GY940_16510 [bacterium]|nr:hypothetical protein [bacterium]
MIGSVSYGFPFSKRPIGGITPIEDILETAKYNTPTISIDLSNIKVEFDQKNLAFISKFIRDELIRRVNYSPNSAITPIKLVGAHRGFRPSALSYLAPVFTPTGSFGVQATKFKAQGLDPGKNSDLLKLAPADAASVPLIKGDFEYSSLGTVTHVNGNDVYLFGHPFFNMGAVDFPLHKAEVITVVPSYESSFKLAATRQMVGRVRQDRFSAVHGELGKQAYMIPMKVFLKNRNRTFNLELASHPLLTPVLSAVSVGNIFSSQYMDFGFQSIKVKGKIFIEGERNIIIDDLYTGTNSFGDFSNLLMAINFFLMNNPEKNIKIQKFDFEITGSETVRRASIENVLINKKSFLPGEVMEVDIYLTNEKGRSFKEGLSIKAPNLKAGSTFYLLVANSIAMGNFDAKNVKSNYFPMKLNPLIRAINNLRKNNRLYLKLMTPDRGLFVKGHEYSNLPTSMQNIFVYNSTPINGTRTNDHSRIRYSTITEYQVELPAVVSGRKLFKLKIKERSNVQ